MADSATARAARVGAALANRKYGRFSVSMQNDGDFLYSPERPLDGRAPPIPLLMVMRNNRCYHQELMEVQRMCNRMNRGIENAHIGNDINDPNIDYAKLAQGWASTPKDRSRTRRISVRRSDGPSPSSSVANRRSSTSSCNPGRTRGPLS